MLRQGTLMVWLTIVAHSYGYSTGAQNNATNPMDAFSSHCTTGNYRPNHGDILPQSSPAPFTITMSSPADNIYRTGQAVTISIEGNNSAATPNFKGFFLQGDATEASFSGDVTCGSEGKKVSYCGRYGVTHVNGQAKSKVTCQWTPPDYQLGRVQFVATIVGNFSTFWIGVKSASTLTADPSREGKEDEGANVQPVSTRCPSHWKHDGTTSWSQPIFAIV